MIVNRQRRVRVSLPPLRSFLARTRRALRAAGRDLTVCLVSDAEMAQMNREFRGNPAPTDVLSFPSNGRRRNGSYLGDIAIAPAVARRNARRLGRALSQELQILILHGVLHLLGYDHETDGGEMDRLESRLRRRLGIA